MKHRYSTSLHNKRIVVLGPLPPPLGGVSVHVQRVINRLREQKNVIKHIETCVEYRYRFLWVYLLQVAWQLWRFRPDEVHLHTLYLSNALAELKLLVYLKRWLRYDIQLIEHDCRYLYQRSERWKVTCKGLLLFVAQQVFIGNVTARMFDEMGLVTLYATVESAFLPPCTTDASAIIDTYPEELRTFIKKQGQYVLVNAFQLTLLDGKDLYGFDQCVQLLFQLRSTHYNVRCIFVLGQIGNSDYYQQLHDKINKYGVQDHCYFLVGNYQLWPLLQYIDIFIRPTLSDGASVSVEEALWLGKTVVASDVCWRPQGVRLYQLDKENDLYQQVSVALQRMELVDQRVVVPIRNEKIDTV